MRSIKYLLFLLCAFCCILSASAQGKSYVGYCDGQIASSSVGKYTSIGQVGNTVSIAIRLSKAQLAAYKGCNLVGVNYGMPTSQGVKKLTGWVRTSLDGQDLTTGSTTSTNYGWREISVSPYVVTGDETELYIGASYNNDSKAYVGVSFAGTPVKDGCYVSSGSEWTNYASQGWGSLSLEAVFEGGSVPTRDLALLDVTTRQRSVQVGDPISVSGVIKNNASESATNPVIRYSINGQPIGSYTHNGTIAFRQSANFSFDIPTTSFSQAITAGVELSLEWADGQADDAPADNVSAFSVELSKEVFKRRMVVEEHTGAWCGYCVRGIVGLKEMKEKYGDDFIGIGIHNNDQYAITAYDNFIGGYMSGYPNSIVNRSGSAVDPSYTNLYNRYQAMDAQADADIAVEATYDTEGKINFTAHSRFAFSETNADYRVAFVVLENQLPIVQTNYYDGSGSAMGGFENLPRQAKIDIDDVARGIYPSTTGNKGSIPAIVSKGEVYDYSYSVKPTFKNGKNVEVVALLIDGKTGEIINGVKTSRIIGLTEGEPVDPVNPGGGTDPDPVVNLTHTISPAAGAIVETLDKVIVKFEGTYAQNGMNHVGYYNYMAKSYGLSTVPIDSRPYLRADNGQVVTKAARVMWTYNEKYGGLADFDNDPFHYNEFEFDFDGVPAGHYTLVVPKNFFVYYDSEEYLCGTKEFTAEYTVTKGSNHVWAGTYDARFTPAVGSELKEFGVLELRSSDDIYNYTNTDLATYYNCFYVEEAERPYVILPNGQKQEVKTVDFAEVTGVNNGEVLILLTFPTSYTEGAYTVVIPQDFIVVGDTDYKYRDWWKAYAAPERRFTFFVGKAPEGIEAVTNDTMLRPVYDLSGRRTNSINGLVIENGRKVMR
ncbi:MAG: Omp28-related outer membrane protein [Bacteroidales bacterium]|nr:Omp28-related outer membrane protein [Bacteroidales bacterium]